MTTTERLYEFAYRAVLTEEALDRAGRTNPSLLGHPLSDIVSALNYELLDPEELSVSERMAAVYAAITAFERSARRFVSRVLLSEYGETWWDDKVSENIRKSAESRRDEEEAIKWHGTRGDDLLTYTELGHLVKIIQQNWTDFEPHVRRVDWASGIFTTIERSRNVIMHSGVLDIEDIERVGMNIRDWVKQVGS